MICLNEPIGFSNTFIHIQNKDMDPEDVDGWRNEMRKYIRSVGNLTAKALNRIKRDRIRNNLPFDGAFQKYFLQKTNAR